MKLHKMSRKHFLSLGFKRIEAIFSFPVWVKVYCFGGFHPQKSKFVLKLIIEAKK